MDKMVPYPSGAIVPERDLDKKPILETHHLGIDFGGLTAVDEFSRLDGMKGDLAHPTQKGIEKEVGKDLV